MTSVALVERCGEVRAKHVPHVTAGTIRETLVRNADLASRLHTDESNLYKRVGPEFATHERVFYCAGEYALGDVATNSVEGFVGVLKRGFRGINQHCREQRFQRYLNEYVFRHNNRIKLGVDNAMRAARAIRAAEDKRLTYRGTCLT